MNLARLARGREDILAEQVCFHAQQATEKALKAVLLDRHIEFPLIHDIEELLEIAAAGGVGIPSHLTQAGALTPYAVETRYPGFWDEITPPEVDEAIHTAEAMIAWSRTVIGRQENPPDP